MIGAHTDSPCLRVKPVSNRQEAGFVQVGVETYGGGLWHTWFDRDLSLAGRVIGRARHGSLQSHLIKIDRPILRIPTLAIHLDRQETFAFNKETQLLPIAGLVSAELNQQQDRHHPQVIKLIAQASGIEPADVVDFELLLYDTQAGSVGGLNDEFMFTPRLDNLCMSFCAVQGLIKSMQQCQNDDTIRLVALFDDEEIGSRTAPGADSSLLPSVLRRLSVLGNESTISTAFEQSLATSFLISADMAHSVHPNYVQKYEAKHMPAINKGPVIKVNANSRYATNSIGAAFVQQFAETARVPLQHFVVRNDSPCGSTIGPMLSAALGTRTLDLGNPQLSMHSIRETGGVYDVAYAIALFREYFEKFHLSRHNLDLD